MSLSRNIFSGASWMVVQTIGTKAFSLVAQLILAWLLLPEDFGKIGLTYAITNIGLLIQGFGLTDVLVSRGKSYVVYLPVARSISLLAGGLCFVITVLMGLGGSYIYHDTQIFYLVVIYCCSIPFNALSVVADAKLRIDLRFKNLSMIALADSFIVQGGTILLACLSFGVYSFVIPPVAAAVFRCIYLYHLAGLSFFFFPTLRRWGLLVGKSVWGFVHQMVQRVIMQADYAILGLFASQTVVGLYYMAYSLSVQVIALLAGNITPVLFPTLMRAQQEHVSIKNALYKCTVFLAMVGIPFSLWQGACAAPLIKLFLPEKWLGTILLVEILSLGMGYRVVSSLWAVAYRLRAKFDTQAYASIFSSIFFFMILIPLSFYYQAVGAAIAVSLFYIVSSPVLLYYSFRDYSIPLHQIISVFVKYSILGLVAFVPIYLLSRQWNNEWLSLALNAVLSPGVYVVLIRLFAKEEYAELINKFKLFLKK